MLSNYERDYIDLVTRVMTIGQSVPSRASNTKSLFDESISFDLSAGLFPLLQGRRLFYKGVFGEFAAMIRGDISNVKDFERFGCNYWSAWAEPDTGNLLLDYGNSWRDFNGVDQLAVLIEGIRTNPHGRRHIITGWRPDRLPDLSLPCCHMLYQWYVRDNYLDMMWYQRSTDVMIGLPSDAILAAIWTILLAKELDMRPGKVNMHLGDTHIYENHLVNALQYKTQAKMKDEERVTLFPTYHIMNYSPLETFYPNDVLINRYNPAPAITFNINV